MSVLTLYLPPPDIIIIACMHRRHNAHACTGPMHMWSAARQLVSLFFTPVGPIIYCLVATVQIKIKFPFRIRRTLVVLSIGSGKKINLTQEVHKHSSASFLLIPQSSHQKITA